MHSKSEVEKLFKEFYAFVENQFQTKISILRTDNGTEYFNQYLTSFLREKGIQHQSTCSYTPQQNGVAERKNHHLLEVSRALMLSMNVPKYLLGEAILTAAYLINKSPSRVLKFNTPLNCLKQLYPDNRLIPSLPLRVFGCTVFVHIPTQFRSKLDAKAEKCVFIGYVSGQRGYKCFNPVTRKTHISVDVFYENQPFFKPHLQGENNRGDEVGISWETDVVLPNPEFPSSSSPSLPLEWSLESPTLVPNLDNSNSGGESLTTNDFNAGNQLTETELQVYTRRTRIQDKQPTHLASN